MTLDITVNDSIAPSFNHLGHVVYAQLDMTAFHWRNLQLLSLQKLIHF